MITVIEGEPWEIIRADPGDPRLIDWTGTERLGTTDMRTNTICISSEVQPPLLDRVLLHEIAHAITGQGEWAAKLIEDHAIEAADISSRILGRPVCSLGWCHGQP